MKSVVVIYRDGAIETYNKAEFVSKNGVCIIEEYDDENLYIIRTLHIPLDLIQRVVRE